MNNPHKAASFPTVLAVTLIVALTGFILAVGLHATWQAPVESAQILAGLVEYHPGNPYHVYLVKLWTLINQAGAVGLYLGLSEINVSILMVGALGALSFTAIALVVLGIGGSAAAAVFTPLLMYQLNLVGEGAAYPIWLMGTTHSYGILGLSWVLLVTGVFAVGRFRTGAFLAGLAPAVHPSLGAFSLMITVGALAVHHRDIRPHLKQIGIFFSVGFGLCLMSLAWQLYAAQGIPSLDAETKKRYMDSFVANFDYHRALGTWLSTPIFLAALTAAVGGFIASRRTAPLGTKIAATAVSLSVLLAAVLAVLSDNIPQLVFLRVLMPWRYFNLANLAFFPIAMGMLAGSHAGENIYRRLAPVLFIVVGLWPQWPRLMENGFPYTLLAIPAFLVVANLPSGAGAKVGKGAMALVTAGLAFFLLLPAFANIQSGEYRSAGFVDPINENLFRIAGGRPGLLLTACDLHLTTLFTRRPVLVDGGALDFFSYALETGPELNRILRGVYGLDIFVPPPPGYRNQGIITDIHRPLWESRTVDDWLTIRNEFGVTDVLTPADWNLSLPLLVATDTLRLYALH